MIAQWENEWLSLSVLPVARVQLPAMAEYLKGFFPGWAHSVNPTWASVAENGSIPLNATTLVDIEEVGRSPTMDSDGWHKRKLQAYRCKLKYCPCMFQWPRGGGFSFLKLKITWFTPVAKPRFDSSGWCLSSNGNIACIFINELAKCCPGAS